MTFIVDVSVALPWNVSSQATALTRLAADLVVRDGAVVPFHFHLEYCNALLMTLRRTRITPAEFDEALDNIRALNLEIDSIPLDEIDTTLLPFAIAHRLTVYDAAYLELALRTGLPLATRDRDLTAAAVAAGAQLLAYE